jgi:hypothetical protein
LQGNCRGISLRLEITEEGEEHGKERWVMKYVEKMYWSL